MTLRRQQPHLEHVFSNDREEPFFVKNLETIQGDERDVIFVSVGYGSDASGNIAMRFGPVTQAGGERRLNVLMTRARKRCEIFSNITAADIRLTGAKGVEVLKKYLQYAQNGELELPRAHGGFDSPFEEAVFTELRRRGYQVHSQVGVAGYFIDLAIVDPEQPGRYLLGIECDGATYHSARSARDRDRLRQYILEQHRGWKIHRIWSTDWFQNPRQEIERVVEAIDAAAARHKSDPLTSEPDARASNPDPQPSPPPPRKIQVEPLPTSQQHCDLEKLLHEDLAARTDVVEQVLLKADSRLQAIDIRNIISQQFWISLTRSEVNRVLYDHEGTRFDKGRRNEWQLIPERKRELARPPRTPEAPTDLTDAQAFTRHIPAQCWETVARWAQKNGHKAFGDWRYIYYLGRVVLPRWSLLSPDEAACAAEFYQQAERAGFRCGE